MAPCFSRIMPKQTVETLIEGGKATAAPPLGPALGPLGVNIGQVVIEINKKTASFAGMQVPVKVTVDTETKAFTISVGTPPTSQLILKEAKTPKGAHNPKTEKVADLRIEQVIKIAKMKETALLGVGLKAKVKEVIGTCNSLGILVQGLPAREAIKSVNEGKFDAEIKAEKTELSAEELNILEEERMKLKAQMEARRKEFTDRAQSIISKMVGKDRSVIKHKLLEAEIPRELIDELLPAEGGEGEKKDGAKPAAGAAPASPKA
jgi:large subunit ribosomal protein L11